MSDDTVARCGTCGSRYTSRAWPWLEALDGTGDRRACPVPGCGAMLVRGNVARGCGCVAANDGQRGARPMTAANAYRWHAVTAALWQREPVAGGATCVLRERRGGYEMSVAGGAWRYAGPELRRAQEHAGGHACAADSAAVAQAMGACPICARLKTEG